MAEDNMWVHPRRTLKLAAVVLVLVAFMFALARLVRTDPPREGWGGWGDGDAILHGFEIGCLLFMLAAFAHAWKRWGWSDALMFFATALFYGIALEDLTVSLSGYYEYDPSSWMSVHNTMLAVPFCWTAVIYICIFIIEENPHLRTLARIEKGLLAGVLAVSIDVGVDASFAAYGFWHWTEGQWFGVPLANYTAWFMAVGGFTVLWDDIRSLRAYRVVKELGMLLGSAMSYSALLLMVYLTYIATRVVF
jgi:uncharacterized membrane protein